MGFAEKALALSVNPHESRGFLAPSSRFRPRLNREFNFNYQGIVIVYLGKLRPISELRNPSKIPCIIPCYREVGHYRLASTRVLVLLSDSGTLRNRDLLVAYQGIVFP